jgi:hypothetical protein
MFQEVDSIGYGYAGGGRSGTSYAGGGGGVGGTGGSGIVVVRYPL